MFVGVDDTDSKNGGCTTYVASLLVERINGVGKVLGNPYLIRLNPTIEFKTRGNGAVAIECEGDLDAIMDVVADTIREYSMLDDENTDPGAVFLQDVNQELVDFAMRVVKDVVSLDEAMGLISKYKIPHIRMKSGRGIIGALAAASIAAHGLNDVTYELLAYRYPERIGTRREIDERSVLEADERTYPRTWNTVDRTNGRIVFAPHSPCPVLYGIRGDDIDAIMEAHRIIRCEPIERAVIFKTNQGTDMHLVHARIGEIRAFRSYIVEGEVSRDPWEITGGHVFFEISDGDSNIKCVAFEPTKNFRNVVRKLRKGDRVRVYGSVKKDAINLEKLDIISLETIYENPTCPRCGRKMESMGRNKGFRCRGGCGTRAGERVAVDRGLSPGIYEVPVCAMRHISKPLVRVRDPHTKIFPSR